MRSERAVLVLFCAAVAVALAARYISRRSSAAEDRWVAVSAAADSALYRKPLTNSYSFSSDSTWRRTPGRVYRIDINSADSVALCGVYGIGKVFSSRILARRRALGGFVAVEQLREIRGFSAEVYDRVAKKFWVDSSKIQKININFVPCNVLTSHPYFTPSMARRVERERMKGGLFHNAEDLKQRDILLPKEAQRVAPYLSFDTQQN